MSRKGHLDATQAERETRSMAYTKEPLRCPHCDAAILSHEDVQTLTRVSGMIVVGCTNCRKVLGVLPVPEK